MTTPRPLVTGRTALSHPVFGALTCTYATEIHPQWWPRYGLRHRPLPVAQLWESDTTLPLFDDPSAVRVQLTSADWPQVLAGEREEGEFTDGQIAAYRSFIDARASIESQVGEALFRHYHDCLAWTDYGHDRFQPVDAPEPLIRQCHRWELQIGWQTGPARELHLLCRCPWEEEHGFIAEFRDEQLVSID